MSKLATKFIENFEQKMKNNNSYEHVVRMLKDEKDETFDDLKKKSLISAWQTVQWVGHTGDAYRYVFAERDVKKYYRKDGTLNEEYLEMKYQKAIHSKDGKCFLDGIEKELYKEIWNIKREIVELSELFNENDSKLYNTKIYESGEGNLELVFEHKALPSFNLNSYFISRGSDTLIMDEDLWPNNQEIYQKNKNIKNKVEKDLSKYKEGDKMVYLDYEKLFEYTIGKPKYIQYYMEQLPLEVLHKYKGKKWTFHLVIIFMAEDGVSSYTAKDEGYVDMLIDYDTPLDLEGDSNV